MPKAYLISGAPRIGKTTVMHALVEKRPMQSISTDTIRSLLRRMMPKTIENQALFERVEGVNGFAREQILLYLKDVNQVMDDQYDESRIVWEAVKHIITSSMEDGIDIAVEGVAVLPEKISELNCEWSAVVLGNTSKNLGDIVRKSAMENKYDWLHGCDPQILDARIGFLIESNLHFKGQAERYNLPFVDIAEYGYENAIREAVEELMK